MRRTRALMFLVVYVALDCTALHATVAWGSPVGLYAFLVLTFFVPLGVGVWCIARRFDRSTMY